MRESFHTSFSFTRYTDPYAYWQSQSSATIARPDVASRLSPTCQFHLTVPFLGVAEVEDRLPVAIFEKHMTWNGNAMALLIHALDIGDVIEILGCFSGFPGRLMAAQ